MSFSKLNPLLVFWSLCSPTVLSSAFLMIQYTMTERLGSQQQAVGLRGVHEATCSFVSPQDDKLRLYQTQHASADMQLLTSAEILQLPQHTFQP